ncbi:MAG TPA: hypothetical protein VGX23_02985 [Actinocrinis sp.]|nr:hypothetical protein [Actinocrinis sp.]
MSSERSYPKPPGDGRPTPPGTETPTVDVAGELATARLGKQPEPQPEPAPEQARPLWSMPTPGQAPQVPQTPQLPPPPVSQEPVVQTQRLPYGSGSKPGAIQAVTSGPGEVTPDSVLQTQRLPYGSGSQAGPIQAVTSGPGESTPESADQTQRLAFPPAAQAGSQPSYYQQRPSQESVDQTQRLAYPGNAGGMGAPVPTEDLAGPERTAAYLMEDTARDQPLPQGQDQFQNRQFQQNQQYPPHNQAPARPEAGGYGGPAPTLRFDQFPENPAPEPQPQTPDGEYRHFGPGVPGAAGAAPNQAAAVWRGEGAAAAPPPPKPKRRRAFAGWLLALAVLGIVLGILGYFYYFGTPVKVTGATVKGPTTTVGCGQTATVTGTIQTNGDTGSVTYEWIRSDDTGTPDVLTQHFNKGTHQANVTLLWTLKGSGTLKATATLKILTPQQLQSATSFTYTCN